MFSPLLPRYAAVPVSVMLITNALTFSCTRLLHTGISPHCLTTALDTRIPFVPAMVVVYLLAFVHWFLGYLVLVHEPKRTCWRFAAAFCVALILGGICFLVFPTVMERPVPEGRDCFSRLVAWVYTIDTPDNLLPSFHCLQSWLFTRLFLASPQVRRPWKITSIVFTFAVCASVLLVKQHVLADIPAGIAAAELGLLLTRPLFRDLKESAAV